MHEAALRGGPHEPPARSGCFLAGAGMIAMAALYTTPGRFPAAALFLVGLLLHGGRLHRSASFWRLFRPAVYGVLLLPLLIGLATSWNLRPVWLALFWLDVFVIAGAALWAHSTAVLLRLAHQEAIATLPADRLEAYADVLSRNGRPRPARDDLLVEAIQRLLAGGDAGAAERLLDRALFSRHAATVPRLTRLRSALAFLRGDLDNARDRARELLVIPSDLEEGRQFRAWAAYLELASGHPKRAAVLADAAVGPQALAGDAWFQHCRALHAWAVLEAGEAEAALELARFAFLNAEPGSPYRPTLRALLARCYLELGDLERAAAEVQPPMPPGEADSFALGQLCRVRAAQGRRAEALAAGTEALAAAGSLYARALALADRAAAGRALGDSAAAEADLQAAETLWPWLASDAAPDAEAQP
jgi:hypothetical protein